MITPEMKWEYSFPVVAGWYWFQQSPSAPLIIVQVISERGQFFAGPVASTTFSTIGCRWCGPITSPDSSEDWK